MRKDMGNLLLICEENFGTILKLLTAGTSILHSREENASLIAKFPSLERIRPKPPKKLRGIIPLKTSGRKQRSNVTRRVGDGSLDEVGTSVEPSKVSPAASRIAAGVVSHSSLDVVTRRRGCVQLEETPDLKTISGNIRIPDHL